MKQCSFIQKKTSVPATHTHAHTDMYTLPKAKQMTHQAHISPKFSNSQNRKHQAKLRLLQCAHTHHFHFDSVFLTYGFLCPPASSLLHVLNLRRYNKPNLNITSAVDTKGRRETQKQRREVSKSWPRSSSCPWGEQEFPGPGASVGAVVHTKPRAVPWSDAGPGWGGRGPDAHLSPGQLLFARLAQRAALAKSTLNWGFLSSFLFFCLGCSFNAIWLNVCKKKPSTPHAPESQRLFVLIELKRRINLGHWFTYSHGQGAFTGAITHTDIFSFVYLDTWNSKESHRHDFWELPQKALRPPWRANAVRFPGDVQHFVMLYRITA